MRKDFIDVYDLVLDRWGVDSQNRMCIEEMSELTKELCKLERYKGSDKEDGIIDNICEELADVINMVEQLERYYGEEKIESIRKSKIDRLMNNHFSD
ncbi:MAG: hypothetical protein IJW59_01975 [Clostridia bacterium]|nr:hypothetical protein [Clostridia bacterium]